MKSYDIFVILAVIAVILSIINVAVTCNTTVPFIVWTFWFDHGDLTSDVPEMSENRRESLALMRAHLEVPIQLITTANLAEYTKWYVHPAVQYLSGVHKADYFRIYFLLHYGGGYSDIKRWRSSWKSAFDPFDDPDTWVVGVPEIAGGVASPPDTDHSNSHGVLISNCFFIARKGNEYFRKVHARQNAILDKHWESLRTNPAPNAVCQYDCPDYPLRWEELLGEIMSDYGVVFQRHFSRTLVMPDLSNYR